jgi:hypothetical protein
MHIYNSILAPSRNRYAIETQQRILCVCVCVVVVVVKLYVTLKYTKILSVARRRCYSKVLSPATVLVTLTSFLKNVKVFETNRQYFRKLHIKAAVKQRNVRLLMALFRRTVWLNRTQ